MNYAYNRATGTLLDMEPAIHTDRPQLQRLRASNTPQADHDAAHGPPHEWARIPCAWIPERFASNTPLTDAIIEKRQREGYFGGSKVAA